MAPRPDSIKAGVLFGNNSGLNFRRSLSRRRFNISIIRFFSSIVTGTLEFDTFEPDAGLTTVSENSGTSLAAIAVTLIEG